MWLSVTGRTAQLRASRFNPLASFCRDTSTASPCATTRSSTPSSDAPARSVDTLQLRDLEHGSARLLPWPSLSDNSHTACQEPTSDQPHATAPRRHARSFPSPHSRSRSPSPNERLVERRSRDRCRPCSRHLKPPRWRRRRRDIRQARGAEQKLPLFQRYGLDVWRQSQDPLTNFAPANRAKIPRPIDVAVAGAARSGLRQRSRCGRLPRRQASRQAATNAATSPTT